jgi:hypothetical protein
MVQYHQQRDEGARAVECNEASWGGGGLIAWSQLLQQHCLLIKPVKAGSMKTRQTPMHFRQLPQC